MLLFHIFRPSVAPGLRDCRYRPRHATDSAYRTLREQPGAEGMEDSLLCGVDRHLSRREPCGWFRCCGRSGSGSGGRLRRSRCAIGVRESSLAPAVAPLRVSRQAEENQNKDSRSRGSPRALSGVDLVHRPHDAMPYIRCVRDGITGIARRSGVEADIGGFCLYGILDLASVCVFDPIEQGSPGSVLGLAGIRALGSAGVCVRRLLLHRLASRGSGFRGNDRSLCRTDRPKRRSHLAESPLSAQAIANNAVERGRAAA